VNNAAMSKIVSITRIITDMSRPSGEFLIYRSGCKSSRDVC
jgi:hypothetical protein